MTNPISPSPKAGIIAMPMVFGPSDSFQEHVDDLQSHGFKVETVDYYATQTMPCPPWYKMVDDPTPVVGTIDLDKVYAQIDQAITKLKSDGCEKIEFVGFGLGADMALWYTERFDNKILDVTKIAAWYPHLDDTELDSSRSKKQKPNLSAIDASLQLYYGEAEERIPLSKTEAEATLKKINDPRKTITTFAGAGHSFADRKIQGIWPNALYYLSYRADSSAAEKSWEQALLFLSKE